MTAQHIVVLRHGRTASNVEGRFQGHLDVQLDDVGHAQAAQAAVTLGRRLALEAGTGRVRVVSSDLARAVETARPLAAALAVDLVLDPALRERAGGRWEGLHRDEIAERYPEEFTAWSAGEDIVIGGGESLGQCWARAGSGMQRQADEMDGGVLVAVGHGASGRGGVLQLCGLVGVPTEPDDLHRYRAIGVLGNCHWGELTRKKASWVLTRWNVPGADT